MQNTAIIIAEAAGERRTIAQLVKPSGHFEQIYFSSTCAEVEFLLKNARIDIVLHDFRPPEKSTLKLAEELGALTQARRIPLVFCSPLDPVELSQLGIIPPDSHCLSYETKPAAAALLLKRLLPSEAEEQPKQQHPGTLIDKSSGVYNRFYFDAILDQEISRSKLTGRPFSLLLIEPNNPPAPKGRAWSSVLPSVVMTIKAQVRTSDLLCRVEQKRFALLLPETSTNNAERVVGRLRSKLEEISAETSVRLNFGLASSCFSSHTNRQSLLRAAEAAL